jgi:hypothetical protein
VHKLTVGLLAVAFTLNAASQAARGQNPTIFFQTVEDDPARPTPARPLTMEEQANLQDPLFRLVLATKPTETRLSEIEKAIQPDPTKRSIFVVDEEIRDFRQPRTRRSVIMFDGSNGDFQLKGNVALSVFFRSDAMPEQDVQLEAWGWDEKNGVYNFYKLDRQGGTSPPLSWKLRGSSKGADRLASESRAGTCLRCHTSGVPVMKELVFPWNNWHSVASRADYLTKNGPDEQRWPIVNDRNFTRAVDGNPATPALQLSGGETLEAIIKAAITRFNLRRFADLVPGDPQSDRTVQDAKILLAPLFDTAEINLQSAQQQSGLHPLPDPSTAGPSEPIKVPDNFFLRSDLLAGANGLTGLGISEAGGFSTTAVIQPAEYKQLVQQAHLQIAQNSGTVVQGDTNFAWLTPVEGFASAHWVDTLLQKNIISPDFAAAALALDLETPIFSDRRKGLVQFVPDTFTVTPGESHPNKLTRQVIANIETTKPAPGSAAAEFLALLKSPSPEQELRSRVTAYQQRIANALADPASRAAELQRQLDLLIARRALLATYPDPDRFPMFGSLIEFDALLPRPAPSSP